MKPDALERTASTSAPGAGDVAAHAAERLGQGTLDHVEVLRHAARLGNAAAGRPVDPDGMHLVEIGHGAVAPGELDHAFDRTDVAVHRVDALERDQLRQRGVAGGEQLLEVARDRCAGRCAGSRPR